VAIYKTGNRPGSQNLQRSERTYADRFGEIDMLTANKTRVGMGRAGEGRGGRRLGATKYLQNIILAE